MSESQVVEQLLLAYNSFQLGTDILYQCLVVVLHRSFKILIQKVIKLYLMAVLLR